MASACASVAAVGAPQQTGEGPPIPAFPQARSGCGEQAAAPVGQVHGLAYLALPVVLDGMMISPTCLSFGLISSTSLFASLAYSYSLAAET